MNFKLIIILCTSLFIFSCELNEKPITKISSAIKNSETQEEVSEDITIDKAGVDISFDSLQIILSTILGRDYDFKSIEEDSPIKAMYLFKPFTESLDFHVVRAVDTNSSGKWVDLMLYEYDPASMEAVIREINNDNSQGELIFGKDWDRILGIGNNLIRINSGCTLSTGDWNEYISLFEKMVQSIDKITWFGYDCNCGLPCVIKK